MHWAVKYVFRWVNRISDDDNFWNVVFAACLVDAASHSEKFSLSAGDENSMVDCFGEGRIGLMNMCNRGSDVVFDASIGYNDSGWKRGVRENQVVEFLSVGDVLFFFYQLS